MLVIVIEGRRNFSVQKYSEADCFRKNHDSMVSSGFCTEEHSCGAQKCNYFVVSFGLGIPTTFSFTGFKQFGAVCNFQMQLEVNCVNLGQGFFLSTKRKLLHIHKNLTRFSLNFFRHTKLLDVFDFLNVALTCWTQG